MASTDYLNAGTGSALTGAAGYAALGPVGWALGAAQLGASLFGMSRSRKQRQRMKEELERRRLALINGKNMAIGRLAEGTAAAKAPLEALAERVRTEEDLRDPVMEQSLIAGVREQFGASQQQAQRQSTPAQSLQLQQLMMAAALGQGYMATESRRVARRTEATRALSGIYGNLSEITLAGAQSASGIEERFAQAQSSLPMMQETGDDLSNMLGGMLSWLNTDTGKEALGGLFSKFNSPNQYAGAFGTPAQWGA